MLILNRSPISAEINDLFNSMFADVPAAMRPDAADRNAPPMNVWEEDACFSIEAELPGYAMNDIEVTVLGDGVTIKGQRTIAEAQGGTCLRRERRGGSFSRTWTLPAEVNADNVEASLRDGVLLVTLPKSQKALPRKIQVKTTSN